MFLHLSRYRSEIRTIIPPTFLYSSHDCALTDPLSGLAAVHALRTVEEAKQASEGGDAGPRPLLAELVRYVWMQV